MGVTNALSICCRLCCRTSCTNLPDNSGTNACGIFQRWCWANCLMQRWRCRPRDYYLLCLCCSCCLTSWWLCSASHLVLLDSSLPRSTAEHSGTRDNTVYSWLYECKRAVINYTAVLWRIYFMTNDEADDRYGSVHVAENDSSRLTGVKLSAVIAFQTEW